MTLQGGHSSEVKYNNAYINFRQNGGLVTNNNLILLDSGFINLENKILEHSHRHDPNVSGFQTLIPLMIVLVPSILFPNNK